MAGLDWRKPFSVLLRSAPMDDALETLSGLLIREREVLRRGRFDELPGLAMQLEVVVGRFMQVAPAEQEVVRLRAMAEANAALLDAAAEGFRLAIAAIAGVPSDGQVMATYAADGTRTELSGAAPRHEKRA